MILKVKSTGLGGWGMAWRLKYVLLRHQRLNPDSQHPHKELDVMACVYSRSAGRQTGRSSELIGQFSQWLNARLNERPCLKTTGWDWDWEDESVVKSMYCSDRRTGFGSMHPYSATHNYLLLLTLLMATSGLHSRAHIHV